MENEGNLEDEVIHCPFNPDAGKYEKYGDLFLAQLATGLAAILGSLDVYKELGMTVEVSPFRFVLNCMVDGSRVIISIIRRRR